MENKTVMSIETVIDYIEANLDGKLDLEMVAEAVHYSKYHLHRMFTSTVGMTIHDYVQRRQLTEAAKLLLGGNFNEEYVSGIKDEIRQMSEAYRDLFAKCSVYLENLSSSSIEKNFLAGIGTAGKAVGTLIGNIPGIKEGPVDEFLVDQGSRMEKSAHSMQAQSIKEFAEISNPQTGVFVDRLEDVIRIFNHTDQICFDRENIYLM